MVAEIISGKEIARERRGKLKEEVTKLKTKGINPHLTVILVGEDPASKSYVSGKQKASAEIGMSSDVITLPTTISENELLQLIEELNSQSNVHGILVQLPLPPHIHEQNIIEAIAPSKDVDGFHPTSIGRMMSQKETFLPCTPNGIMKMMEAKNITISGKHAVVVGRSNIVGKPVGQLLLNENATVTYCHSRTKNLQEFTRQADILIVAVGKPHVIRADDIKQGAVVIDVGVNRIDDGSLTGDVDFMTVKEKAGYITPVPGGVGPMTITMLLENTIRAAKGLTDH